MINELLKSFTDRCRIGNGLYSPLPIISYWRRVLVECVSFAGDPIGCVLCLRTRLHWLPPRVAFFLTSEMHAVIAHLCLLLPTPLALSPQKATPVPTITPALSPYKVTRLICVLRCPTGLSRSPPPAARAVRITLNFSPYKASDVAGWPAACVTAKGANRRRPHRPLRCRHGRNAASNPPSWPRSPRRKSSSIWKLIAPFYWNSSPILILLCVLSFFVSLLDFFVSPFP
jgi:hypothetical protein